ncbi:MAG: adenylosuccinate lyase, partial [Patescibacteria group bacterium]|nr:adenylosuccinate lyase [Patescibacteria group bacterium]
AAEPLYLLLASLGHPDAHEAVRTLTLSAQKDGKTLENAAFSDPGIAAYIEKMSDAQKKILKDPISYSGIAAEKTKRITEYWKKKLGD